MMHRLGESPKKVGVSQSLQPVEIRGRSPKPEEAPRKWKVQFDDPAVLHSI